MRARGTDPAEHCDAPEALMGVAIATLKIGDAGYSFAMIMERPECMYSSCSYLVAGFRSRKYEDET